MEKLTKKNLEDIFPLYELAIVMDENDNVAIAKSNIKQGAELIYKGEKIKIVDVVPKGYRFSLCDINKGKFVIQYGQPFGLSRGIRKGQKINRVIVDKYEVNYESLAQEIFQNKVIVSHNQAHTGTTINRTFMGYKRKNGRVGTRNYYLVVPTSLCASDTAVKIANSIDSNEELKEKYKNIDGVVAAAHTEGCGCNDGEIIDRLLLTLKNTIIHPNVGGALIVDLGCEKTNYKIVSDYFGDLSLSGKPIDYISIQELGGTGKSLKKGQNVILNRLKELDAIKRESISIKHLVVGTECGASDSFSGITANPVIGLTIDKIISEGGSAILSEMPEMIGGEMSLLKRMASKEVAQKFIKGMNYYKELANRLGVSMDGNLVKANEDGGLVNLTLKSFGAILKGGSTSIVDFLDYSEQLNRQGLSLMNGPGNDLESLTGMVASGANIILFSTGMGTTEGNLISPVIKISTRTEIYEKMKEDIDFNAGSLLDGDILLDEISKKLLNMVIEVASGEKTCSEIWGKRSFQIWTAGKLSL